MIDFKNLVASTLFFLGTILRKKEVDVLFYYPAHFNRIDNRNPYFTPLIEACKKRGVRYLLFEEPELSKSTARNPDAVPADLLLYWTLLLRKLMPKRASGWRNREWKIGRLIRKTLMKRVHFSSFITISQSMVEIVRGIDEKIRIFDLQHGVLHPTHEMVFDKHGVVASHIVENRIEPLLFGKGFRQMLVTSDPSGYYRHHAHVIGYPLPIPRKHIPSPTGHILVSLQFMDFADSCPDCNEQMLQLLRHWFEKTLEKNGDLSIRLRHHPRYDGKFDISPLLATPQVSLDESPLISLLQKTSVHVTFNSSTLFEASALGVPTLLLGHPSPILSPNLYRNVYHYPITPLSPEKAATESVRLLADFDAYRKVSAKVQSWYTQLFSPFDEERFIRLVSSPSREAVSQPSRENDLRFGESLLQ